MSQTEAFYVKIELVFILWWTVSVVEGGNLFLKAMLIDSVFLGMNGLLYIKTPSYQF